MEGEKEDGAGGRVGEREREGVRKKGGKEGRMQDRRREERWRKEEKEDKGGRLEEWAGAESF